MTPAQLHLLTVGEAAVMRDPETSSATAAPLADPDELAAFARQTSRR